MHRQNLITGGLLLLIIIMTMGCANHGYYETQATTETQSNDIEEETSTDIEYLTTQIVWRGGENNDKMFISYLPVTDVSITTANLYAVYGSRYATFQMQYDDTNEVLYMREYDLMDKTVINTSTAPYTETSYGYINTDVSDHDGKGSAVDTINGYAYFTNGSTRIYRDKLEESASTQMVYNGLRTEAMVIDPDNKLLYVSSY